MASNLPAQPNPPGYPQPGLEARNAADSLPLLTFTPGPSLCQTPNLTAVTGNPGVAGPVATMPTTVMQDFGQPMGQTIQPQPGPYASDQVDID